jgi:hypothetical protein
MIDGSGRTARPAESAGRGGGLAFFTLVLFPFLSAFLISLSRAVRSRTLLCGGQRDADHLWPARRSAGWPMIRLVEGRWA